MRFEDRTGTLAGARFVRNLKGESGMHSRRNSLFVPGSFSRRTVLKGAGAAALATGVPFSRLSMASAQDDEIPMGGVLRVALVGEANTTMDAMYTTSSATAYLASHVFETLFTVDAQLSPRPMLIEDYTLGDDGLTYTFKLRSGVQFHNGKTLGTDDVLASLNRWGVINGRGRQTFARLNSMTKIDDLTFEMVFDRPTGIVINHLSQTESMIMPAEIAEAAGEDPITEFIGTGPFRFEDHVVDQYLRLVRYDDYAARDEEPDGPSGRRVAYLDQIDFIPVPDESVRANGLISGEYHFAESLPPDYLDTLELDPNVNAHIVKPYYIFVFNMNKQKGLFTDARARRAMQLMFSQSEALKAGFGRDELIRADASIPAVETIWHNVNGADAYDNPDPEQARALMEEAGYNGEKLRWLTTQETPAHFRMAQYVQQRAGEIDVDIELVVSDFATLFQTRTEPDNYEIFSTSHPQFMHPATMVFNDDSYPGWWVSEAKDEVIDAMLSATDHETLMSAVDDYTALIWEEMPLVKFGDSFALRGTSTDVINYKNVSDWFLWNVGLD